MGDEVIDLREYARVLRRQSWVIALVIVLVTATAVGVTFFQTPRYAGEAELVIEPVRRSQDVTLEELLRDDTIETERRVIASRPVRDRVVQELGGDVDELAEELTTSTVPNSRVVLIRVTDADPDRAAALANAVADAYLAFRRDTALADISSARRAIEGQVAVLRDSVARLDDRIDTAGAGQDTTALEAERQSLLASLGSLVTEQSQLGDAAAITGGGTVIAPAETDDQPVSPRPIRTGVLALVLGLLLGVGLALLRDHVDDRIRSDADVERASSGRPVIGRIPVWNGGEDELVTLVDPHSVVSESYATLATNLRYLAIGRTSDEDRPTSARVVVVVSAGPGEGKTSTAANLAVAAARAGRETLLIDADLRRPTIAKRFSLPNGRGLSDAVAQGGRLLTAAQRIGTLPLAVIPSGPIPPNPADVVASGAMSLLIETARTKADLVVIDTPPTQAVADAVELAQAADAVVLVVRADRSHRRRVAAAVSALAAVGIEVAGTVVNGVGSGHGRYAYGYRYDYRADDTAAPSRRVTGDLRRVQAVRVTPGAARPVRSSTAPPMATATATDDRLFPDRPVPSESDDPPTRD